MAAAPAPELDPDQVPETPRGREWPRWATVLCACGAYVGEGLGFNGHRRGSKRPECHERPTVLAASQIEAARASATATAKERNRQDADAAKLAKQADTPNSGGRVAAQALLPPDPPASAYGSAPIPIPGGKVLLFQHTVRLRGKTWTTYEVACNDAELAFDGSFDEFLDECVEAFFQSLGYLGVGLVRAAQPQQVAS